MKVKTITMWYSLEETKNRIPDMELCGEPIEKRYRGEAKGSEKIYGFGHIGTNEKLFVFESPIDLLSYITAVPEDREKHSYISLGGLSEKAMKRMYTEYPQIHSIYLCLDNDEPGNRGPAGSLFLLFRRD